MRPGTIAPVLQCNQHQLEPLVSTQFQVRGTGQTMVGLTSRS